MWSEGLNVREQPHQHKEVDAKHLLQAGDDPVIVKHSPRIEQRVLPGPLVDLVCRDSVPSHNHMCQEAVDKLDFPAAHKAINENTLLRPDGTQENALVIRDIVSSLSHTVWGWRGG